MGGGQRMEGWVRDLWGWGRSSPSARPCPGLGVGVCCSFRMEQWLWSMLGAGRRRAASRFPNGCPATFPPQGCFGHRTH